VIHVFVQFLLRDTRGAAAAASTRLDHATGIGRGLGIPSACPTRQSPTLRRRKSCPVWGTDRDWLTVSSKRCDPIMVMRKCPSSLRARVRAALDGRPADRRDARPRALSGNNNPHLSNACPNGISNFAGCAPIQSSTGSAEHAADPTLNKFIAPSHRAARGQGAPMKSPKGRRRSCCGLAGGGHRDGRSRR
jgi:hypothetical protein